MKKWKSIRVSPKLLGSCAALALAVLIAGSALFQSADVPELPEFTDPVVETEIEEEETPLASKPKVTTKTSKKTTKKKVKISKAASKTYKKTLPTTKKTTTKKQTSKTQTVTTQTTVATATTEQYTKKSKVKAVSTTVTTTVKTTTVAKVTATPTPTPKTYQKYTASVDVIAPKMDSRVIRAYQTLGFTITVDPDVSYSGYFAAKTRSITLNAKQQDLYSDTIYHELGHFLAFIAGNADQTASFKAIYAEEKSQLTGVSKTYASQSSSEFFAECVKLYVTTPATLKSTCPKTYAAITSALDLVTDARVAAIQKAYRAIWK